MRKFDGIFLEFPLCALAFDEDEWIDKIISYCIVEHSINVKTNVRHRINELEEDDELPNDFDRKNIKECQIILAAKELGIIAGSMKSMKKNHNELENFINGFINKYGKQPFCRIGKKLCFEARDGKFDKILFRVLCAIQSKLGKQKSHRIITQNEIIFRMWGCKNREIFEKERTSEYKKTGRKKIKSLTDILEAKDLISKFTYARRHTYYSTRLDKQELINKVKESKKYWAEKKLNIEDELGTQQIKEELEAIKKKKRLKIYKIPTDELVNAKTVTS